MSKRSLFAYLGTLFAFLVLDGLWLGVLMGPTYKSLLGPLMLDQPRLLPAVLFYLLYALGCVVFVVLPSARWQRAARLGALLGLVGRSCDHGHGVGHLPDGGLLHRGIPVCTSSAPMIVYRIYVHRY